MAIHSSGRGNMMLGEFHFLRPWWLLALLMIPIAMLLRRRSASRASAWHRVVDVALLPHVLASDGSANSKSRLPLLIAIALCYTLAVLALAGPVWERVPRPVYKDRSALVIMLDLSKSMDAQDIKPSRLARARFKIADLLAQRGAGLTALVVYAADAYGVVPLTDDTATILSQLPVLETALMPAQGSVPERAVTHAVALLEQSGVRSGDLLLITDSISGDGAAKIQAQLQDKAHRLSVLAVGTQQGAPIPDGSGEFVHDDAGKLVLAQLDTDPMLRLARATHGRLIVARNDQTDVAELSAQFRAAISKNAGQATDLSAQQWREEGPWLLLPVLPLLALLFRRGLLIGVVVVMLSMPSPSSAGTWIDLWSTPDQKAAAALTRGDAATAAKLFQDQRWQAAARYRNGDFGGAVQSLRKATSSDDFYNRGNALARLGKYEDAIAAYDQALSLNKNDTDAQYNRDLLQKLQQSKDQNSNGSGGDQRPPDQKQSKDSGKPSPNGGKQSDHDTANRQSSSSSESSKQSQQNSQQDANAEAEKKLNELLARQRAQQQPKSQPPPKPNDNKEPPQDTAQSGEHNEKDQADEQWLRRIPDDPGGLLRRKFYYQYSQSNQVAPSDQPW